MSLFARISSMMTMYEARTSGGTTTKRYRNGNSWGHGGVTWSRHVWAQELLTSAEGGGRGEKSWKRQRNNDVRLSWAGPGA
jgi:hypothetical protein